MAKKRFTDVQSLLNYVTKSSQGALLNNKSLERELAAQMSKAVVEYVYSVYQPKEYERRANAGGLSDMRNMMITNIQIKNGKLHVMFENLTKGNDNLNGEYTSDLIEGGEGTNGKHWSRSGEWMNPRPFVANMKNNLKANPDVLMKALKQDLMSKGFRFK